MERTIQLHHRVKDDAGSGYAVRIVNRSKYGRNYLISVSSLLRLTDLIKKNGEYKNEYGYDGYYIISL